MDINEDTSVNISNIQKKNINKDGHDIKKRMERKKRTFVPLIKLIRTYIRTKEGSHTYICTYVHTYIHNIMYLRTYVTTYVAM